MVELKLGSATVTTNTQEDYSVPSETTDAQSEQDETTWTNEKFNDYLGYYKNIPEVAIAINTKATWTVGKGLETDPETQVVLDRITGFGKDTFNTILENLIRTAQIGGDAFAEIIRDDEGELINLKPLDPSTIDIVVDSKGILKRYEQRSKVHKKQRPMKFKPEDIFHLPRNRVADEVHGTSIIANMENVILMRNEAMSDWKKVLHRNVFPMRTFSVKEDDPTRMAAFKAQVEEVFKNSEILVVPEETVKQEINSVAINSTLNPLAWIESLNDYFYESVGVPKIVIGNSKAFTDASSKIAYLAFQQTVEEEQLFIEEQIGVQLGLTIDLKFPASLENDLLSDEKKDGAVNIDPSETTAGVGQ